MMATKSNRINIARIAESIKQKLCDRVIHIMEVCGTHTVSISRAGLRTLLAPQIQLISGPGCPVCVTPASDIAAILWLAEQGKTIVTFGDMMKVPAGNRSLFDLHAENTDIHIVYSPLEALRIAAEKPQCDVIFIGVGFETTAPAIAGAIIEAHEKEISNLCILTSLKTIPIPLRVICNSPKIGVDGFMLPGHVSAVIGSKPYRFIAEEFGKPGVITGFEPEDIIDAIFRLSNMLIDKKPAIEISYSSVVHPDGNIAAKSLIERVFEPCDSDWRGIGALPASGLSIRGEYSQFDARRKYEIPDFSDVVDNPACRCADVILGLIRPTECPLFENGCTPELPQGPCMISSEGACAAYHKYGE